MQYNFYLSDKSTWVDDTFFGCKVDICKEFFFDVVDFYVCRVIERNQ